MRYETSIDTIQADLEADKRWRERRDPQWTENYQLYRDTVITNRLTQRQSVNVPLMKETVRTGLSRASEPAELAFEDYENNGIRELLMNAYWEKTVEVNKYEKLDVVDKKIVQLYGRSHTKLNIVNGMVRFTVHDGFDVLVDRYAVPWDIDTAKRVTHVGVYRTLDSIILNPLFDKTAVSKLVEYFKTRQGLVKAAENASIVADRNQRLAGMGVPDIDNPILGNTYVELNEQQRKVWHEDEQQEVVHVIVTADGNQKLMEKPLRDLVGVNFFLWTSWTDDPEATDYWCDGTGDIVRQPNHILNAYYSQLVETGILRGYGMNFYDATAKEGWSPVGYVPAPWGFYPLPGKPGEVLQHVDLPDMRPHMEEMNWMKQMVETATAARGPSSSPRRNSRPFAKRTRRRGESTSQATTSPRNSTGTRSASAERSSGAARVDYVEAGRRPHRSRCLSASRPSFLPHS